MHNVVEVDTWTAAVSSVDDGDAASAANFGAADQHLANRSLYLRNRTPGAAASIVVPISAVFTQNTDSRFSYYGLGTAAGCPIHSDVTSVGAITCKLLGLPATGTITAISALVTGLASAGAHGGLLGTAPTITLNRITLSTGALFGVTGALADPYATTNQGLYEAQHAIASGALAEAITNDRVYHVNVTGEGGANAANNKFSVYGFKLTITP